MLISDEEQSDSAIHAYLSIVFKLFSHMGYYKYRVECPMLYSVSWLVILYMVVLGS